MQVRLRAVGPDDLRTLTRMAVAFNDEEGHPLLRRQRAALQALCEGTPHGLGFMIESERAAI